MEYSSLGTSESSACGVGLMVSLQREETHENLVKALTGLKNLEHRGGVGADGLLGDGAGIMTSIPFEMFGYQAGEVAVATIFGPGDKDKFQKSLKMFEETFGFYGLEVIDYREVPIRPEVLSPTALANMPSITQAFVKRPKHCRTLNSFDSMLYHAKQLVRTKQKSVGIIGEFFFTSLSSRTINYKALATSEQLVEFFPDLKSPAYKTNFAIFHRRFSTNTLSSWDKVQPFRLVAHNGEINTIEGNRLAALTREKALGLASDELITHFGASDSGNLNGMVEALKYRSSIPNLAETLSILIPPAGKQESGYFQFWSRAMEPWDGPALIAFCDGKRIGARLDRNGFRPCRWMRTESTFFLASEAGCFEVPSEQIMAQGSLYAGRSVSIHIFEGTVSFENPDKTKLYQNAHFDARTKPLRYLGTAPKDNKLRENDYLFYYTKEDVGKVIIPMVIEGKEPIGSMGDTARIPAISPIHRSIYDYFYQNFAQVTNPPLDYIREKLVTELKVYLGRKPNIFEPKELIPPPMALQIEGPVLSLGQLDYLKNISERDPEATLKARSYAITFKREQGVAGLKQAIKDIVQEVVKGVQSGISLVILTDRDADKDNPPIPAILVMRAVQLELNRSGRRLRVSIIVDTGEVRDAHQLAVLIGFGASAVCPYIALDIARNEAIPEVKDYFPDEREKRYIKALNSGLLRIMAKRGISVLRSYQGAELFTILGLSDEIIENFFPGHARLLGGLSFESLVREITSRIDEGRPGERPNIFLYKELPSGKRGEKHSMTSKRARLVHQIVKHESNTPDAKQLYEEFIDEVEKNAINIRHLLAVKKNSSIELAKVQSVESIMQTFGCGAMSFGAISAESQRDLILAFEKMGGRSNSGEGGENPYYFSDGITSTVKQLASGRFGVTAEYLVTGQEVQIKIAQGAKPGEGGQLMGVKVNEDIAKARFANPGVDLISPPPQHDIYSIEDLKELIFELKQLRPGIKVSVKLVAGKNIGAIALGVVKAGADVIQISGGDGGTGAAALMSMKHTGLPWEYGLWEVHKFLTETEMRERVVLRVDGGLQTGRDILMGALLGADEFDFGKLALISQGCIMARVCEKNTCPAGIATHNPKFKAKYTGQVEEIVRFFKALALDVRRNLYEVGAESLREIQGRGDLLENNQNHIKLIRDYELNLEFFKHKAVTSMNGAQRDDNQLTDLNQKIVEDYKNAETGATLGPYQLKQTDRAVGASLAGHIALEIAKNRRKQQPVPVKELTLMLKGSAGQGLGVFTTEGMNIYLEGEANDSVAKGMSGGKVVITPPSNALLDPSKDVLVGNACLYGANGGKFFLNGMAGDRFCVRNSGTIAVLEGAGLHACEYMTNGTVVFLGRVLENIGAGMTGGQLYLPKMNSENINRDYLIEVPLFEEDEIFLKESLEELHRETKSLSAMNALENWKVFLSQMQKYVPIKSVSKRIS